MGISSQMEVFFSPLNFVQSKTLGQGHYQNKGTWADSLSGKILHWPKKLKCIQYKNTAAILSLGLTFARFIFSKTNSIIPEHVLHS
jgi:hypothetical protein